MSLSVADIYENYLESLQNLPSEIDQNMHELRRMDDDLSNCNNSVEFRETYARHKKAYTKQSKLLENTNTANMISARLQLEKDYKTAMQKQEQKIELANRMYELVSRHIERLDSQVMTSSTLNKADWIKKAGPHQRTKRLDHHTNNGGIRKRIHHSSRPNPTLVAYHGGGGGGGGGGLNGMSSSTADMIDPNEPTYCYCNQVSFGDMIACDGENCEREWFHYSCVGLVEPPAGKWFCEDCSKMDRYSAEEDEGGDSSS